MMNPNPYLTSSPGKQCTSSQCTSLYLFDFFWIFEKTEQVFTSDIRMADNNYIA